MKKFDLTTEDHQLIASAAIQAEKNIIQLNGQQSPPQVAAGLRLDDGQIIISTNLIADVGGLSICAEPMAISAANRQPGKKIAAVVAVYHAAGQSPKVVSPCGHCREMITDYAPEAFVILRDPGTDALFKVQATDLLPLRYAEFWKDNQFI